MYDERRAARAIHTFRVRFSSVDRGPNVYSASIYIDGARFGYVLQRRGGPYEAFLPRNRKVAEASSLSRLRELIVDYYAADPTPA